MIENVEERDSQKDVDFLMVNRHEKKIETFKSIEKVSTNLYTNEMFKDDQFKIVPEGQTKTTTRRLAEMYDHNTPLFVNIKTGKNRDKCTKTEFNLTTPTYLSEINMLPFFHYQKLIEPNYINPNGFYYVVMWKDGVICKEIVDDEFIYDEKLEEIDSHPQLRNHPWIHILIKAWAKKNKGYENLDKCDPFDFVKTFSYPDWEVINPSVEKLEYLIHRLSKVTHNKEFMIAKTKANQNVGLFGFSPNCASFLISGHYQEYGGVFVKIKPFVYDRWNGEFCDTESELPQEMPHLDANQFLIPSKQFLNVFHLLYTTNNKFCVFEKDSRENAAEKYEIFYNKYTLSIDARDTKAKVLAFEVPPCEKETPIGLSLYFPKMNIFDLMKNQHRNHELLDAIVPWCKVLLSLQVENYNADVSYVESVREKLLENDDDNINFIVSNNQYEYIFGDYFQGFSNEISYNLSLKPGKYFLRLKSEQKKSEYRCYVSTVCIGAEIKISDSKMERPDQIQLLKETLASKTRNDKKNITYLNKIKKGSWISLNNDFNKLGYCTIVAKTIPHSDNKIIIQIDPKALQQHGYLIKDHKDLRPYTKQLDQDQSTIIILKYDKAWKNIYQRLWPPPGIEFFKVPRKR